MYSEILVGLAGLTPGREYCAQMVASNGSGTAHGAQVRFATAAPSAAIEDPRATPSGSGPPPKAGPAPETEPRPPTLSIVKTKVVDGQLVLSLRISQAGAIRVTGDGVRSTSRSFVAGTHCVHVLIARTARTAGRHGHTNAKLTVRLTVGAQTLSKTLTVRL
jgi:hypothetical protein